MFFELIEKSDPLGPFCRNPSCFILRICVILMVQLMSAPLFSELSIGVHIFLIFRQRLKIFLFMSIHFLLSLLQFLDIFIDTILIRFNYALFSNLFNFATISSLSNSIFNYRLLYSIMLNAERSWSIVTWLLIVTNWY